MTFATPLPRHPGGSYPGQGMIDTMGPTGTRVGVITRVDELSMKCSVKVITGGGDREEIDLTQAMAGPRSFWGGVPEVNSLVIIGYRPKHKGLSEAVILGYLPVGNKSGLRFDPFTPDDPNNIAPEDRDLYEQVIGRPTRYKRLMLRPGDVGGMSADGSELTLSRDVRMVNRAGDLLELRDAERSLVTQAVHSFSNVSGVCHATGPIRRQGLFLPTDIFQKDDKGQPTKNLRTEKEGYYGTDNLQGMGPGGAGSPARFADASGKVLDAFNNKTFPPVTYTNGKKVFYAAMVPGVCFEDGEGAGAPNTLIEARMSLAHDTDATPEVLGEIDGFTVGSRRPYIEQVFGTVVGNDTTSTKGITQYGQVLKPKIFDDWESTSQGVFELETVDRAPGSGDIGIKTEGAGYLFRMHCTDGAYDDNPFAVAVSKQGKLYLSAPGSRFDRYPMAKNISAEVNLQGALKMFVGAESSSGTSIHLTTAGSIDATLGRDSTTGRAINLTVAGSIVTTYVGNNDETDVCKSENISGNCEKRVAGNDITTIDGAYHMVVNGQIAQSADQMSTNAHSGYSLNTGEWASLVSGKSQYNYALMVMENIIAGGKLSTILAGGCINTVAAGVYTVTAGAGAVSVTAGAGAVSVTAGAAMSMTAGAALSMQAGAAVSVQAAAALSLTAGLAVTVTSSVSVMVTAPIVQLGGPAAVLGVCRGIPAMPPGAPSLDPMTGVPLMGAATIYSM